MQTGYHVKVKALPDTLQRALQAEGYRREDIAIRACETACLADMGGQGRRGFVTFIDLATGRTKTTNGSWGGSNMFNPRNAVDNDQSEVPIPDNVAVIQGSEGHGPTFASVLVNPQNMASLLPAPTEVTDHEKAILTIYATIKGGYRQGELDYIKATADEVTALVERGLLKRNKAGATQITTEGKNAR